MIAQIACALSSGNRAILDGPPAAALIEALPAALQVGWSARKTKAVSRRSSPIERAPNSSRFSARSRGREGPIASVFRVDADTLRRDEAPLDFLLGERSLCVNTTAAGGNASLMSIG